MQGHPLVRLQFFRRFSLAFSWISGYGLRQEQSTGDCWGKEIVWCGSQNIGTQ
jgi:hypothetical protein